MAILDSEFAFTGSLGNLTAYRMRGKDGIVLRRKSGASADRVRNDPAYENTRKINAEFSGRSAATRWIMKMMYPMKALADYNIAGPLNAILKPIQELDTQSALGMRHVLMSRNPKLLEGFSLNRKNTFESIVRCPLSSSLSRKTLEAVVTIPELVPGINFHVPQKYPLYGIVVVLGVVPDLLYTLNGYEPSNEAYAAFVPAMAHSEWFATGKGSGGFELKVKYPGTPPDENFSLMLTVGIRFGTLSDRETVQQIKYAGAGKVWLVA